MRQLCVFCGSGKGRNPAYVQSATELGTTLAKAEIGLVYGGGRVGLMGVVAGAVRKGGGHVTGVMPTALQDREFVDPSAHVMEEVATMRDRKERMCELSDAFIALPGGIGTLEELFEVVSLTQLSLHDKPVGLLNVAGFYDPLLSFLQHAREQGFISSSLDDLVHVDSTPAGLIARLRGAST